MQLIKVLISSKFCLRTDTKVKHTIMDEMMTNLCRKKTKTASSM